MDIRYNLSEKFSETEKGGREKSWSVHVNVTKIGSAGEAGKVQKALLKAATEASGQGTID